MYEKVKRFYDLGLYTAKQVEQFLRRGFLTQGQYQEIVGDEKHD